MDTNSGLANHYRSIAESFEVTRDPAYGELVVPNGNSNEPVHRWFHLKEGYSCRLFEKVVGELGLGIASRLSVLDPYAGVGTTCTSALQWGTQGNRSVHVIGIECNPFLHFVAQTKARALAGEAHSFREFSCKVLELAKRGNLHRVEAPALSTFSNTSYFPPSTLGELLDLRTAIESVEGFPLDRALGLLALAGCVEPSSSLRRDGRALRYEPAKVRAAPTDEFKRRCNLIRNDLIELQVTSTATLTHGDGRSIEDSVPPTASIDLALFSPPYPNNIDYTEVYKLEAWFLQFYRTRSEFYAQRLKTARSHPSVKFDDRHATCDDSIRREVDRILSPVLSAVPRGRWFHWQLRLIKGYFEDMLSTFIGLGRTVRPGGHAVYVVGNSIHGTGTSRFLIAADILMARLAELAGFTVERIVVAREPRRRRVDEPLLRESAVYLRNQ